MVWPLEETMLKLKLQIFSIDIISIIEDLSDDHNDWFEFLMIISSLHGQVVPFSNKKYSD
jgi:hypothetical protein